jgi:hypothetical protein
MPRKATYAAVTSSHTNTLLLGNNVLWYVQGVTTSNGNSVRVLYKPAIKDIAHVLDSEDCDRANDILVVCGHEIAKRDKCSVRTCQ